MQIKLKDGTILSPILVTGREMNVQGALRDTLSFIFDASSSMEELDSNFSQENCETITIVEDSGTENIYKGYTIRAEMSKASVEVSIETSESSAVYEERITVSMSQRTYAETQMAQLASQLAMQEECIVEMAGIVYA